MSTLAISLPPPSEALAAEYDYVSWSPDGGKTQHGSAPLALLPPGGLRAVQVLAVVPAQCLSWHLLSLPAKVAASLTSPKADATGLRSVLGGALEEQLLDAPEALHFAVFASQQAASSGQAWVWVAVCDKTWLAAHVQALTQAGLQPTKILPEAEPREAPLPARIAVDASMEPACMVLQSAQGVVRLPWTPALLTDPVWMDAPLSAEPAIMGWVETALGRPPVPLTRADRLQEAAQSPRNLAQGEWSAKARSRWSTTLRLGWQAFWQSSAWKPARWALAGLLLVHVLALNLLAYRERVSIAAQKEEIRQVFAETFPAVPVVVDAPVQMRKEVKALAQARAADARLNIGMALNALAHRAPAGQAISAMQFSANSLQVEGLSFDDAAWTLLLSDLRALGYTAERKNRSVQISGERAR